MDLLHAVRIAQAAGVRVATVFLGDGPARVELERTVNKFAIRNVVFAGFQNQTQLPRWLSASDILVFPAEREAWGLAVNEAMAVGLPVIASTDVGAARDLVTDRVTGYTFTPGDTGVLSAHVINLCRNTPERKRLGKNAKERIARWSLDATASAYAEVCEALLEERHSRPRS
jgi:glycosyltransferase involved in cell wall biosynthesis